MDLADNEMPPSMGTLDINEDLYLEDMKSEVNIWGRLYPLVSHFKPLDLSKDEYSFGRGDECDYCFNTAEINKITYFQTFSKVHFKLKRQQTNSGFYISLEDMSSNGTFINGEKIGKGKKQALTGNSEICLSLPKNKVFLFMDLTNVDDNQFPAEIKEKYVVTKVLGRGACGEVRLAFTKGSCIKHAIKIIAKKKFASDGLPPHKTVMNEVNILKKLKHPCIIRIEDVIDTPETLYIVLELSEGGELFDRVVSQGNLPEHIGKLYFFQMIHAVKYLHDQGISHRDLKPENVLLATDFEETLVKITDFGLSKLIDGNTMLKTFCGTPTYLAPEIIKTAGLGAYTKAVDCWSLGVILFICLVGYPPFSDEDKSMPLRDQIMKGHYSFPKQYWKNVSEQAIDLVKKLLTVDPKKRITLDDAINHVWFKDDNLKVKVRDLMYPNKDGMIPPNISKPGARKRPLDSVENEPLAKKSSIEAMTF